jgi:two-component system CheB/CheR fusion protein
MTSRKNTPETSEKTPELIKKANIPDADNAASEMQEPNLAATNDFPIVGIGASAGGLAAYQAFFSGIPQDSELNMAFVLVQHLSPDHKSLLTELIQRATRMPVEEVHDGTQVKPNCVFIIPPNHDMALINGKLQLLPPSSSRGLRLPIDFFFNSLALDQRERAIAIILSGTGSDGSLGVRAIKGEGGLVMVQKPETAKFDPMPLSAIATGSVDFELPPAEMPAQLLAFVNHEYIKHYQMLPLATEEFQNNLNKIFLLIRIQSGHDFSKYKSNTINRRIQRRMAVNHIKTIDAYSQYLQQNSDEVYALFCDLLIGVTNFFRDPDAFIELEKEIIPTLITNKLPGANIRVWIPGCSTGEEAYSIAILLLEEMYRLKTSFTVQIFATDIDSQAIAKARSGFYPCNIANDLSPERLKRFFTKEHDGNTSGYRITKNIRNMLIFSEQDVTRDPPFSKIDLISCRNLLIYMNKELQEKLLILFNYALSPHGILFLGSSESIGDLTDLFAIINRKANLYRCKDEFKSNLRVNPLGSTMFIDATANLNPNKLIYPIKLPVRDLTEQALLQQIAPGCALVNYQGDILYLHGKTGMCLEPAPGESGINNILKMAREGLRNILKTSLFKAITTQAIVHCKNVQVKTNNHLTSINLTIRPVTINAISPSELSLYLIIFEEACAIDLNKEAEWTPEKETNTDLRIDTLKQALVDKEEHLMMLNEELSTTNEELRSTNEELQSNIEELQSTNEELETAKEELQSINEELSTVNTEQLIKVKDLARINNDMINLMAGTGIGTLFVDNQLCVMRFTGTISEIICLIQNDIGRPINHIAYNLKNYHNLVQDIEEVLSNLVPKQMDLQSLNGKWYTMRILPYRTLENIVDGAVITFIDITEIVQTRTALHKANEIIRMAVIVNDSNDAICLQDLNGQILAWNPGAERLYGWTEAEALKMNVRDRIPEALQESALADIQQLNQSKIIKPYLTQRLTCDGRVLDIWMTETALIDESGKIYAIATTERLND